MSYQVLARKWRPASFEQMVGQEHVLRALVNALDDDRLHHAYLFTGTRGVGKTSIARLFAKSLNCEQGVSSKPCGQCAPCREISEGRFVDLIEVDAASRTKVEDTRELLENVQYAPTRGRYKVYLIDEVHMLSSHSFNALLKTLEEPPPHIKFLLATTDPHKLPVTILSRCLQFNLKNMTPERIQAHLAQVLAAEQVPCDEGALWLLSRAADGSMRDALSLTDQAIAFGAGEVREEGVRNMLGSIDQQLVVRLLECVGRQDVNATLQTVADLAEHAPDYDGVLAELLSLLHRVTVAQMLPGSVDNSQGDRAELEALARSLTAEDVQLFYQIALNGRRDLPLVPNPRDGLEMTLMRMLAFRPLREGEVAVRDTAATPGGHPGGGSDGREAAHAKPGRPDAASAAPASRQELSPSPRAALKSGGELATPRPEVPAAERTTSGPSVVPVTPVGQRSTVSSQNDAPDFDDDPPPWGEPAPSRSCPPPTPAVPEASAVAPAAAGSKPLAELQEPSAELQEPSAELHEPSAELSAPVAAAQRPIAALRESAAPAAVGSAPAAAASEPSAVGQQPEAGGQASLAAAHQPPGFAPKPLAMPPPGKKPDSAPEETPGPVAATEQGVGRGASVPGDLNPQTWVDVVDALGLAGMTYNIAANMALVRAEGQLLRFELTASQAHLLNATHQQRIVGALERYLQRKVDPQFDTVARIESETPAQCQERRRAERLAQAVAALQDDEVVQTLMARFDARLDSDSVRPIDP